MGWVGLGCIHLVAAYLWRRVGRTLQTGWSVGKGIEVEFEESPGYHLKGLEKELGVRGAWSGVREFRERDRELE